MKDLLHLQVITPERVVMDLYASRVTLPEVDGYITLLPGHAALAAELGDGNMEVKTEEGETRRAAITGGYLQVQNNVVKVLANSALMPEDINLARAKEAADRARKRLGSNDPRINYMRALSALHRAEARISVASTSLLNG